MCRRVIATAISCGVSRRGRREPVNGIGIVVAQRLMRHRRSGGSTASRSRKAGVQPDVASGVPQRSIFTKALLRLQAPEVHRGESVRPTATAHSRATHDRERLSAGGGSGPQSDVHHGRHPTPCRPEECKLIFPYGPSLVSRDRSLLQALQPIGAVRRRIGSWCERYPS